MRAVRLSWCLVALTLALVLSQCGFSSTTVGSGAPVAPTAPAAPAPIKSPTVAPTATVGTVKPALKVASPTRIVIPTIGVDTTIETVGVLPNGDLETPSQSPWDNVGWYGMGPRPGELGSSVIDGHVDRPGPAPAVFWNLRYIHVGDGVIVLDAHGKTRHFRVTGIGFYPPLEAPLQQIFGNRGGTYLNLITCAGDWIPSQHQTTLRLVVYTVLG